MWTLGKVPHQLIFMTYQEFCTHTGNVQHTSYQQGYHAGNQAKNAKKKKLNETEQLLAAIAPGVVLPSRNAETYAAGPSIYGDSLPIVENSSLTAEIDARFNMKESEMEDAA